jgi:hypothetical protein
MGFFSLFVRGQPSVQALPRVRRSEADATSYVADYLTRSVRRASGFVLARKSELVSPGITSAYPVYPGTIAKMSPNLVTIELFSDGFYSTLSGCPSLHNSLVPLCRSAVGQL